MVPLAVRLGRVLAPPSLGPYEWNDSDLPGGVALRCWSVIRWAVCL